MLAGAGVPVLRESAALSRRQLSVQRAAATLRRAAGYESIGWLIDALGGRVDFNAIVASLPGPFVNP